MTNIRCKLGGASWTGVTPYVVMATEKVKGCPQFYTVALAKCRTCSAFQSEEE